MKIPLTFLIFLIPFMIMAQGPIIRNPTTTNQFMNSPSDGWIPIWNNAAGKWSNGVNVASSTNLPAYLQTGTLTNLAGTGLNSAATNSSSVLPNLIGTGVSPGATNASAYIGSSTGKGTNSTLFGTIQFGDGDGAGVTTVSNDFIAKTRIRVDSPANVSLQDVTMTPNRALYLDITRDIRTLNTIDSTELGYLDGLTELLTNTFANLRWGVLPPLEKSGSNIFAGNTISNFQRFATNITYVAVDSDTTNGINNAASGSFVQVGQGTVSIPTRIITTSPQNTTLRTIGKQNITYRGNGTTFSESGKGRFWSIVNSSNIVIEGFIFQGFASNRIGDTSELDGMIVLQGTNRNITIRNCAFLNAYSFGVTASPNDAAGGNVHSDFVLIEKCFFFTNGTYATTNEGTSQPRGAAMAGIGNHWTVQNNYLSWCDRDFEVAAGLSQEQRDFSYLNNISEYCLSVGLFITGDNTNTIGMVVENNVWRKMMGGNFTYFTNLSGNITNASPVAVQVTGVSNLRFVNNTMEDSGGIPNLQSVFFNANGSNPFRNWIIANNTARNNLGLNIAISGPYRDVTVVNNHSFNENRAFYLAFTDGVVAGNEVSGGLHSSGALVIGAGATNIAVVGNRVTGSDQPGLSINASAENITYYGNVLKGNASEISDSQAGTDHYFTSPNLKLMDLATNSLLYNRGGGIISTVSFSGLTLAGGVLTATASGGGILTINGFGTNTALRGVTLPTLTASRAAIIDANGNLTNATSASPSTDFVHADGSVGAASGSPAGGTGDIQFNEGGSTFAGTNEFRAVRGTGAYLQVSNTSPVSGYTRLNGGSLIRRDNGSPGLAFGVNSVTNWQIDTSGHWIPNLTNAYDIGSFFAPVRTNYVNDLMVKDAVVTPTVLSPAGNSIGTNFPNVNLLVGATNLQLVAGVSKAFYQSTNANNYVNLALAVPESGYEVTVIHTNSAATNYTVTFFTNSVAASFYSVIDKTNATSWVVPTGAIVSQRFLFFNGQWLRVDVSDPQLALAAGNGINFLTNGLVATIEANSVLTNLMGTVANNVTNENSTALQINSGTLTLSSGVLSNLNASTIDVPAGGNIISNVYQIKYKAHSATAITVSNVVINFNTNTYFFTGLTNIVLTNIVEESASIADKSSVEIWVKGSGPTTTIVWPVYGAQHGYFIRTNANNNPFLITSVANGAMAAISLTATPDGTNIVATALSFP